MAVLRDKPYSNYNFLVDLGTGDSNSPQAGFCEVILPYAAVDVIQYRSGNDKESGVRKIPGRAHYGNVIFKRGVIGSLDLYQWWDDVRNGNVKSARTVTVQLQNEDHTEIVMVWKFLRAWPVRYEFSPLDAKGKETLIESLELAFERLEME
ncbi:MAG: phage tail protein [Pyrinomonadaceae bacterium]